MHVVVILAYVTFPRETCIKYPVILPFGWRGGDHETINPELLVSVNAGSSTCSGTELNNKLCNMFEFK